MDEKGTMTATFEPTLDVWKLLEGKPTEYVVVNPVTVEASFKDGRVVRYPQEVRERVVRCRNCTYGDVDRFSGLTACHRVMVPDIFENPKPMEVEPDGFCAWGKERGA